MNMQDKEFDDIFRSQLEGFEAEPSSAVWQNITHGLDGGDGRKKAPLWWLGIAASLLLVSGMGWWLVTRQQPVKQNIVVKLKPAQPHQDNVQSVKQPLLASSQRIAKPGVGLEVASPSHTVITAKTSIENKIAEPAIADQPKTNDAILPVDHNEVLAAAPVNDIHTDIEPEKPVFKTTLQPLVNNMQTVPVKRRGHTLGDLINKVVASVDKRADKLIEFTDTDEDESTITGINLGLVKIKKENK